ncbi:hypothetical protein FSP39_012733 [Pinctada imbricata]|uniref:protein-tyrosine-phosphatase n=1 Tax=Pinctada imbricata TaxID=66713 RepID=A0AA88XWK0_PINIB|nr:hypothetical protein FSP39_012733 [Pinctada imbricata]
MPFGLRFKRTRRYDISTKNVFVVGVEMLDRTYLECTLNADSTGQECLDSIAQRIELSQTQYFGLRYVTKKMQYHWVDLTKPLKKQLDKTAQPSSTPRVYFGVMLYVSGAHRIIDESARYQYFLQLKNDIVEGRIPMSHDQVLRLAAFSLQAEFGDYDYDRVPEEYFQDNPLFPKMMCRDENVLQQLMNEALNAFISLQGVNSVKAEVQYIKEIQMMDGYGMEYYTAKDEKGKDLYLGTSYSGIMARYLNSSPSICFRWAEIARVTQSKKIIEIDTSKSSYHYTMDDTDTAKYFKRMGYLQQKFYKSNKGTPKDLQPTVNQSMVSGYSSQLAHSQTSLTYSQHSQYSQQSQLSHDTHTEQDLSRSSIEDFHRQSQQSLETSSITDSTHYYGDGPALQGSGHYNPGHFSAPHHEQTTPSRPVVLPEYRPSPSYEDVMRQRMAHQQHATHNQQPMQQHVAPQPATLQGQQLTAMPGQHQHQIVRSDPPSYPSPSDLPVYGQRSLPPDVTFNQESPYMNSETVANYVNNTMYANVYQEQKANYLHYSHSDRTPNVVMHPTHSSPDLNSNGYPQSFTTDNVIQDALPFQYKPPPPYPMASNSTPDLAVQTVRSNVSDSPDLVSRKNLGLSGAGLNQSFENLAEVSNQVDESDKSSNRPSAPEISVVQAETDDASSDHSGATFHVKDTDSEMEETGGDRTPQRQASKTKIEIKVVSPDKVPPPSTSKEVITRRESFRRFMIARSSTSKPIALVSEDGNPTPSNLTVEDHVIPEHLDSSSNENVNMESPELKKSNEQDTDSNFQRRFSSRRFSRRSNLSLRSSKRDSVKKASELTSKLSDLSIVPPVGNYSKQLEGGKLNEEEGRYHGDSESSESDFEQDATIKLKMGPLKMAAMNGLTMSRPMVLALMNDETRAPKDERRKILENKLSENLVFKEFEEIPKKVMAMDCSIAKLSENESRNRFKDVLPYDASRVKLSPRKDNSSGYINASHIKLSVGDRVWWYIATQAPLEDTSVDFWQMVWEQEVDVIAMLTDLMELGKRKCFPYWPQEIGPEHKITFGQYEVTLLFCNDSLCYITNRISVVHTPSKKERQVWHLQYTDWPDHGCPDDMYGFLGFLDEVESVQRLAESEEGSGKKSPILVHCSAGVGRTGVVILTQVMKWCLEHNHDIDLPRALGAIRQQRMFMVQTLGQYNFIHKTLIQYLKNTRLI